VEVFGTTWTGELETAKSCIGVVPQGGEFQHVRAGIHHRRESGRLSTEFRVALAKQRAEKYLKQLQCGSAASRSRDLYPGA